MRLRDLRLAPSPERAGHVRLTGDVTYDDRPGSVEPYWFEVPETEARSVSRLGNPWLACLVPLAFWLQEPLQIDVAVDGRLRDNVRKLTHVWHDWFPQLGPTDLVVQVAGATAAPSSKTAALFSGGVDSYFTVLRREPPLPDRPSPAIDDLLHIWGFDYPASDHSAYQRVRSSLEPAARELGKTYMPLRTNLRDTRWREAPWAELSHGCALAAAALVLEERYRGLLIPATHTLDYLDPWGSRPDTDPLLSTSRTTMVHDGANYSRVAKTNLVAHSEIALRTLRVCWKTSAALNCSECSKCYRTMATLLLLGALDRCATFDRSRFDLERLAHVFTSDRNTAGFLREVRTFAVEQGRDDVARSIDRSFRHSLRLRPAWWLCSSLSRVPYAWRWSRPLERRLLAHSIV